MADFIEKVESKGKKASWTADELARLEVGYQMGAPLRILALSVGRTPTAVNKALCRFGIRPMGLYAPGAKPGGKKMRGIQAQRFLAVAKTIHGEPGAHLRKSSEKFMDHPLSSPDVASHKLPLLHDDLSQKVIAVRVAKLEEELWSLPRVIAELRMHGFNVHETHRAGKMRYLTSRGPMEPWQLVVILNKRRLAQGLAAIHVDGVTAH